MATVTLEKLTCEYEPKPHTWTREPTRGRKPKFCPKHVPEKSAPGTKELYCVNGKHNWLREPIRGRVPASCPKHTITPVIASSPRNENGKVTLHCEIGNHEWERTPQKGKRPVNCPEHSPSSVALRSVPVSIVAGSGEGSGIPEKKKPGRPRIHETPEEAKEAQLAHSRERAANLDSMLKERGTHVSQAAVPYILYKKVEEKKRKGATEPTTTWEKVAEHSALQSAQWINEGVHEKDLEEGRYRYEHNGKVINLL